MGNLSEVNIDGWYCGGWWVEIEEDYIGRNTAVKNADTVYEYVWPYPMPKSLRPWYHKGENVPCETCARRFLGAVYYYQNGQSEESKKYLRLTAGFNTSDLEAVDKIIPQLAYIDKPPTPEIRVTGWGCGGWMVYINDIYQYGTTIEKATKIMTAYGEDSSGMDEREANLHLALEYLVGKAKRGEDVKEAVARLKRSRMLSDEDVRELVAMLFSILGIVVAEALVG